MKGVRLPKIGELVEFCSLFKEERIIGIVTWAPDEDEIARRLKSNKSNINHDSFVFKVLTQQGEVDYWTEWEWNYLDTNDVEKEKD